MYMQKGLGRLGAIGTSTADSMVTSAFESLFGRTPAASGLTFYANDLVAGTLTPAGLNAALIAGAAPADLAYYNAHNGAPAPAPAPVPAPTPSPTAAPASSNQTTAQNIAAEAAVNPNAIIMTPGVNDYAALQKNVYQNVGTAGGTLSVPQTWVALTGHTDQWWQEVQAAYTAGKSPTLTTFPDTWLSSVPSAGVPLGSAQAVASMDQVLPVYIAMLQNEDYPPASIAQMLAERGVTTTGAPTPVISGPVPVNVVTSMTAPAATVVPTPTSTPASAPAPTPTPGSSSATSISPAPSTTPSNATSASSLSVTQSPSVMTSTPVSTSYAGPAPAPAAGNGSYTAGGSYATANPPVIPVSTPGTASISPIGLAVIAAGLYLIADRKR